VLHDNGGGGVPPTKKVNKKGKLTQKNVVPDGTSASSFFGRFLSLRMCFLRLFLTVAISAKIHHNCEINKHVTQKNIPFQQQKISLLQQLISLFLQRKRYLQQNAHWPNVFFAIVWE
jgi:hypothetical protein